MYVCNCNSKNYGLLGVRNLCVKMVSVGFCAAPLLRRSCAETLLWAKNKYEGPEK